MTASIRCCSTSIQRPPSRTCVAMVGGRVEIIGNAPVLLRRLHCCVLLPLRVAPERRELLQTVRPAPAGLVEALIRISIRDGSSLVRPMLNVRISYEALNSMILSKIAERSPESIRCPSASIVSLAAMEVILVERRQWLGSSESKEGQTVMPATSGYRTVSKFRAVGRSGSRRRARSAETSARAGAVLDVPPQPHDEVVDGAGVDAFVQPPHLLQDRAPGDRLALRSCTR